MNCTVVYGISSSIKHRKTMTVENAFRMLPELRTGSLFVDIYYQDRLVYTTQCAAGYRYKCSDCPYHWDETRPTRKQLEMIYGG